ncbi:TolB amino-terminal domain-containing protein [Roseovarius azorensis]|uniref:TolB amino-terminal domain-containing protein n=1 Tax=Roseovarius azorensis TaxID=1287727 RepID=A0A1H7UJJ1_9RHOB|nr:LuxR C-terminal-related transcriptional regulator [Roseovarius azorensis]SEL96477.1 TolB amino-terminal domain-containing protein [Roseovarius azorensis]
MEKDISRPETLSARERQIAEAFSGGDTYQAIAERLCIAPSTVRTHLTTIYRKLGVSSKLDLHRHLRNAGGSDLPDKAPPRPDKPSIAVLAFENMSGDPEQEYFSDGITEDIITALSRSPWLFIIARNTTFTYKGQNVDIRRVATELGVRFVLEGSVRRAGERIRVTAQLIDGLSGGHVWSERYDGQLEDVFDLQDEITRNVVASIQTRVHLTTIEEPVERSTRPDLTVWELTMRAWHLLYDFTPQSFDTARGLLHRALALDPVSAEATMVLSLIQHHTALMGYAEDARATITEAYELGRRATELDERNEYAHWAFGISGWGLHKHDESIVALQRAVELNPNCSLAYGSLGTALGLVGRSEEAIANQQIAIRSNPRDPSIFFRFSGIALAHYMAGRFDAAVEWAARAIHRMPRWYIGHFILTASHVQAGRLPEAQEAVRACLEVLPEMTVADLDRMPLKDADRMGEFRACLQRAGLPER